MASAAVECVELSDDRLIARHETVARREQWPGELPVDARSSVRIAASIQPMRNAFDEEGVSHAEGDGARTTPAEAHLALPVDAPRVRVERVQISVGRGEQKCVGGISQNAIGRERRRRCAGW